MYEVNNTGHTIRIGDASTRAVISQLYDYHVRTLVQPIPLETNKVMKMHYKIQLLSDKGRQLR